MYFLQRIKKNFVLHKNDYRLGTKFTMHETLHYATASVDFYVQQT
jgi:hypothetical protein